MAELDFLPDSQPQPVARRGGLSLGSIVLLAGILAVAAVFGVALLRQQTTQPTSGPAPDFTLTTFDGETITLSDLRGQVVVVNFWASWCGPCRDEAPALQAVWEKYRDRGVLVVGVAYVDNERNSRDFIEEFGLTYPNGADVETRISDRYHIRGVPETFIIDQQGEVAEFIFAAVNEDDLSATLDALLET
jgi:cytochrome c biogenesis protein CcmG/thiol:disulfide interchange protein DsbE